MRSEIARVAFSLASSMSCSRTFGLVLASLSPAVRMSVPSLSARANSRWVCRRPSDVAYQPASSASDLNLGTLLDLRGILPPLCIVHLVGRHNAEQLSANCEHNGQVPATCGCSKELPSLLALDRSCGNRDMRAAHGFFYLDRGDTVAQNVRHGGGVPVEALDIIHPSYLRIYDNRIYSHGACSMRPSHNV